jgi:hypothetical protein
VGGLRNESISNLKPATRATNQNETPFVAGGFGQMPKPTVIVWMGEGKNPYIETQHGDVGIF